MIVGCGCVGFAIGAYSLSTLGFCDGGVTAATFAASWQSALGNVTEGSTFAKLQALGATGMGKLLLGGSGAAMLAIIPLINQGKWCENSNSNECNVHAKTIET